MLDSDLAKLFEVETKRINEAVKRNIEKFPNRFSFNIEEKEMKNVFLVAKCDQKIETRGGRYKNPRVFTEQGVAMLATILKSKVAITTSIQIMDAFVLMRKYISSNNYDKRISNVEIKLLEHDHKLDEVFDQLETKQLVNEIYFNGQIYDAYSKIVDIMSMAKKELIIIDGYADKNVLDMISKLKVEVTLITKKEGLLTKLDIEKYNRQYQNLKIIYNNTFHDRYLILDNNTLYHSGASINKAGSKTFSINKIEDEVVLTSLQEKVKQGS